MMTMVSQYSVSNMKTIQKQDPIPIYVIAPKQSQDQQSTGRRDVMKTRLAALDLDFTFIDAVMGKDLTDAELSDITSRERQNHLPTPLSKGAIGNRLSHLKIWKKVAENDAPMALILEDDAELMPEIIPILNRLKRLEDKIDIVNLHFRGGRVLVDVARLSQGHNLASCRYTSIGTESYIITQSAAARLARTSLPMIFETDLFMNRWWDHGLHILTVNPPVVREDSSPTTIGYPPVQPAWPDDCFIHRLRRRLNRISSSMLKRRLYPSMVATAKMRLMGTDPQEVGNNPEFPNLISMTDDDDK